MTSFHAWIAITVLCASHCRAAEPFWRSVELAGGVSVPTFVDVSRYHARYQQLFSSGSIVKVNELQREIVSYVNDTNRISNTVHKEPNYVRLKYQIEKVYIGDSSLEGQSVSATTWRRSGKSLSGRPHLLDFLPEADDEGICYVNKLDGKLTCVRVNLAGATFPVFKSGAHNSKGLNSRLMRIRSVDYKEAVGFADELAGFSRHHERRKVEWAQLYKSSNSIVAIWAIWQLGTSINADTIAELVSVCGSATTPPMVQTVADDLLLSADTDWYKSPKRQLMLMRWLSLEIEQMSEVMTIYLNLNNMPAGLRSFDVETLKDLTESELGDSKPNSRKYRFLEYLLNRMDKYIH